MKYKVIQYNGTTTRLEYIMQLPKKQWGQVYVMLRLLDVGPLPADQDNFISLPLAVYDSLPSA